MLAFLARELIPTDSSRADSPLRTVHKGLIEILDFRCGRWQRRRMADSGLNATAAALLGLLHEGPMTGGQLMSAASRRLGPFWSMTRSQVYRELPALAEMGYVRLGKPGPRSSQPYAITAAGKRAFGRWLNEPLGRDQLRNPVSLRVAFGGVHSATQLRQLHDEAYEYHTAALEEARDSVKVATKEGDEYGATALQFAVAYHRASLNWLKKFPG